MNDDKSDHGRRGEERLVVNREFESIEEFITEYVSNISKSGVFIRTEDPLPVGTRVELRFTVIVEDFETIEGEGEVVRVVEPEEGRPAGMGVVFRSLSGYSQALLERLLVKRATRA
jgi:uncharacterized protein (TIGR02266 family)